MENKNTETTIKSLLDSAKSVIVILPPDPGKDLVSAGISLHLALKESGKTSQIGCGSEVHSDSPIEGISEISDTIGSRNLIISFDYQEEDLEKVDYDVRDDGKFYLLIKPKDNAPVPDIGGVKYSYSGANADLVITLGVSSLEELGRIYAEEKNYLDQVDIISLNTSLRPTAFTSNLFHQNSTSFAELTANFLERFDFKTSSISANNLLQSLYESTNHLSDPRLTADTFSAVAFLMRAGGQLPRQQISAPRFSQPPFFEAPQPAIEEDIPLPEEESQPIPSDWNKPKIFRVAKKNGQ